jgi:flagellin-like protein
LFDDDSGMSPVVGVALMIAITVALAAVTVAMLLGVADPGIAPTQDTAVSLDPTNAGTTLVPEVTGSNAVGVRLNGESVATIDGNSTGREIFLPTAPGDEVMLVTENEDATILVREQFEAGEAGDFVAYYPFTGSGTTVEDHSRNGNDGTFQGSPQWVESGQGPALEFDGSDDYVTVDDLKTTGVGDVEEFTVAVTFEVDSDGSIQQLVEHNSGSEEWHIETTSSDALQFAVNWEDGHTIRTADDVVEPGQTYVAVGTYDGETYRFYLDGTEVANATYTSEVNMGEMQLGKNDPADTQYFDGRMYEFRLYYTAFDDHQVEMLTKVMD